MELNAVFSFPNKIKYELIDKFKLTWPKKLNLFVECKMNNKHLVPLS